MLITTYSFLPFPLELRTTFELPAWPHTKNQNHFKLFENYMKDLKVFYYQDTDKGPDGKIPAPIIFEFEIKEDFFPYNFIFLNSFHVSSDEFKIIKWPADKRSNLLDKLKAHPVGQDMMAWRSWNVKCVFENFRNGLVKRKIVDSSLDPDLSMTIKSIKPKLGKI